MPSESDRRVALGKCASEADTRPPAASPRTLVAVASTSRCRLQSMAGNSTVYLLALQVPVRTLGTLHLIKMNGGRRPNQGRGAAKQHEPGRGKRPHLSRRGTIQITMINIIHIPTGRDGMRRGGNEIIMVHGEVPVGNRVAQYVIRIIRIMYYQYV